MIKRLVGGLLAVALIGGLATAPPASAGDREAREAHCVVHVVGQRASGELVTTEPACYASFAVAMQAEQVDEWGPGAAGRAAPLSTFTIGRHFDGFNFTGASISVVGSNCSGGWLNLSADWQNRISSTQHGCPHIRHYEGLNLTGASQITASPGANLSTLNNKARSIQYLN